MDLAIVNTYFKKKDEHRVTYKSGEKSTQVDYVMCRRRNLKEMCDCKVILNECVAKQHRMVVCKMVLMVKKKKAEKIKPKIRWWKLKETSFGKEVVFFNQTTIENSSHNGFSIYGL